MKIQTLSARILAVLLALAMACGAIVALAEAVEAPGTELLKNGDFSAPLLFRLYSESGGEARLSVVDGEMQVDVASLGSVGHAVQLYYDGFKLIEGVVYTLSFDVRASVPRDLSVRIQLNGGDYHSYYEELINVTEETRRHEADFTMQEATDPSPRLCVNMGRGETMQAEGSDPAALAGHKVWFDNFSLTVKDASGAVAAESDPNAMGIRVNQVGYPTNAVKTAVFANLSRDADAFTVVNAETGETAFEGTLADPINNAWAGEVNRVADFSALTQPGNYRIVSADGHESPVFAIGDDVYAGLLRAATKMLFLQRCGVETDAAFAGDYAHPACHTALAKVYDTGEQIDVSGGWHDAGDYGRYVVSGAKAAADLMLAHELRGSILDDVGIPESGDGLDDLLQEAKFELDWMLKMQAASGGVYHKVSCRGFPGFIAPEKEPGKLIVCPISNTATGDFAAVMAMASRLYAADWPEDAAKYLDAARRAWDYLGQHEGEPGFRNPPGISTGEYGDENDSDERFWAAAELARATGEAAYREAATALVATGGKRLGMGWLDVGTYGLLAALTDESLPEGDPLRTAAQAGLDAAIAQALDAIARNPYGADRADSYEWGSNMGVANTGAMLMLAGRLGREDCRVAAQQPLDYLLGKNSTGYCFVTATGTKSPENPHHRPSAVARAAMPGMLVGGPDSGLDDPYAVKALAGSPPAKCYVDSDRSYSTNEVCVYWNSPLVLLLAAL